MDRASRYPLLPAYGGVSPREPSHGESSLDLVTHRSGPDGPYLLDEPEAALSVKGRLALVARITRVEDDGRIARVDYDDAEPVAMTRSFLASPERFPRHLLGDTQPKPLPTNRYAPQADQRQAFSLRNFFATVWERSQAFAQPLVPWRTRCTARVIVPGRW